MNIQFFYNIYTLYTVTKLLEKMSGTTIYIIVIYRCLKHLWRKRYLEIVIFQHRRIYRAIIGL